MIFVVAFIPTYKVKAKTLGDLKKELSNLELERMEKKIKEVNNK